ncbi:MAG: hypothetical protein ABII71_04270, partial [Candidatus Micrarchaeota archaeon]
MCVAIRQLEVGKPPRSLPVGKPVPRPSVWESKLDENGKWAPGIKDLAELRTGLPLGLITLKNAVVSELQRSSLLMCLDGNEKTPHLNARGGELLVLLSPYTGEKTISRLEQEGAKLVVIAEVASMDGKTTRVYTPIKASQAIRMPRVDNDGVNYEI